MDNKTAQAAANFLEPLTQRDIVSEQAAKWLDLPDDVLVGSEAERAEQIALEMELPDDANLGQYVAFARRFNALATEQDTGNESDAARRRLIESYKAEAAEEKSKRLDAEAARDRLRRQLDEALAPFRKAGQDRAGEQSHEQPQRQISREQSAAGKWMEPLEE